MRSAALALLVCLALGASPTLPGATDNARSGGPSTYEERSAAESMTRSRYRNLEVASLVLIVVVGGAAILWAIRKR